MISIAQTVRRLVSVRREKFPGHIVSAWWHWVTKFLPDLNTCHFFFFFWSYLKVQLYQYRPKTLKTLTVVITQKMSAISPETICRDNYRCIENQGRYASHTIIKNNYNKMDLSLALSVWIKICFYVRFVFIFINFTNHKKIWPYLVTRTAWH